MLIKVGSPTKLRTNCYIATLRYSAVSTYTPYSTFRYLTKWLDCVEFIYPADCTLDSDFVREVVEYLLTKRPKCFTVVLQDLLIVAECYLTHNQQVEIANILHNLRTTSCQHI